MNKVAFTRKEAAEALSVSLPTLDGYLNRRENPLPCFRAGRKPLIPVNGLHAWAKAEAERQRKSMQVEVE